MTYIVKERIGLPIWDDEFVKGVKHFLPGASITDDDFEEARQDEDEKAMLLSYNTYTSEQWSAKLRLDEIERDLLALQQQADSFLMIDYENLTMSVADENQDAYASLQVQINDLETDKRKQEEVLNGAGS